MLKKIVLVDLYSWVLYQNLVDGFSGMEWKSIHGVSWRYISFQEWGDLVLFSVFDY